jgi:hypothetical protein
MLRRRNRRELARSHLANRRVSHAEIREDQVNNKQLLEDLTHILVEFRRFSHQEARDIGDRIGVDWEKVDIKEFAAGLSVELEHGAHDKQTDVTHNDLLKTGRIVLAHLKEYPDYYKRLKLRAHIKDIPPIT